MTHSAPDYTTAAVDVLAAAHQAEHDFAGWLADVLARLAARLGSSAAVVEGRSGSWEAGLVLQLLHGTVGENDDILAGYRTTNGRPE
jgi:hypothetical protein